MRALVTGGSGFIGSRLVDHLAEAGHDVLSLDVKPANTQDKTCVETVIGDVCDLAIACRACAAVDVVFHCAGGVASHYESDPYAAALSQQQGTITLVEACRRAGVRTVVFASSFYVYAGASGDACETTPLDIFGMGLFGASKLAGERVVAAASERGDLDYVILRLGSAYGPGQSTNAVGSFLAAAVAGEPLVVWGGGQRLNQYTHVDDICVACLAAAVAPNETFNIVSPEVTNTLELANLITELVGGHVLLDPTHEEPPPVAPYVSSEKALRELGWSPRPLRDALIDLAGIPRLELRPAVA